MKCGRKKVVEDGEVVEEVENLGRKRDEFGERIGTGRRTD